MLLQKSDIVTNRHPEFGLWRVARANGGEDNLPRDWPPDLTTATRQVQRMPPGLWATEDLSDEEADNAPSTNYALAN